MQLRQFKQEFSRINFFFDITCKLDKHAEVTHVFITAIFCLSLFDFLTWMRYLFFNSVKHFRWYFAPIAIRSTPTILTSSRESLSSVIIVLKFASVSNVGTWRRSPSSSRAPFSHKKHTSLLSRCRLPRKFVSVESQTARLLRCCCVFFSVLLFQVCSC